MKGWKTTLMAGLAFAILAVGSWAAAPPPIAVDKTKKHNAEVDKLFDLPAVFSRAAPQSSEDLRAMQEHFKKVVKKVTPAVVAVQIGQSAGSGVIIDADGTVLTAGHVSGKPGQECVLILPDGKRLKGKTFGYNRDMDSGMIKITDKGPFPYVKVGDARKLKVSEWVLAIGHPGGFKPTRSTVVRVGRVKHVSYSPKSDIGASNIVTDCTLVGGDSGGPLFDMQGRVVGIHSQIRERITDNVHVPVNTYTDTYDRLVKGEAWGNLAMSLFGNPSPPANSAYLGVVFEKGTLRIDEVTEDTPADKAGLKAGDVVVGIDSVKLKVYADLTEYLSRKRPGDEVTIVVTRDGAEMKFKVRLARRPD